MKKIIYSLLVVCATSLTISSCSEEEIKPNTETVPTPTNTSNDKGGF